VLAALRIHGPARVVASAAAAGSLYGPLAALLKTSAWILAASGVGVLAAWDLTKEIHASHSAAADLTHTPACGYGRGSGPQPRAGGLAQYGAAAGWFPGRRQRAREPVPVLVRTLRGGGRASRQPARR